MPALKFLRPLAFLSCTFFLLPTLLFAQGTVLLRGSVTDAGTGEKMPFVNIAVDKGEAGGMYTDGEGNFRMNLSRGAHILQASHIGYDPVQLSFFLMKDTVIHIVMQTNIKQLNEMVVKGEKFYGEEQLNNTEMSTISLDRKQIRMIPNLGGEQDIVRLVQLLPGVSKGVEGTGDFFVRGGDADQNLLLLDGATIYNTGHLFGFVSVFNPDVIGEATFIKGAFPAGYGGRLSSILDVRTRSDVPRETEVEGSIGVISSRLTVRKPLMQDRMVVMISARRTYIDRVLEAIESEVAVPYYFYDVNGKVDFQADKNNKFFFSAYLGADVLDWQPTSRDQDDDRDFTANFDINNNSQSFGWQYLFTDKTIGDLLLSRTYYDYRIFNSFSDNEVRTSSGIEDYQVKYELKHFTPASTEISLGTVHQHHQIDPIVVRSRGLIENFIPDSRSGSLSFLEGAFFAHVQKDLGKKWRLNAGYRQSYAVTQGTFYPGFEPRLSLRYKLGPRTSLKAGYSRMTQYMHRVSSSAVTLPVDLWYGVTPDITPLSSDQWVIGYVASDPARKLLLETEIYYKGLDQITEYEEGTNLLLNSEFESSLLQGKGTSYGWEVMLKKESKKWEASVSYTLNWSFRNFEELNRGKTFPAKYDRRHNGAVMGLYNITERAAVSVVWEYISGSRFTPVIGQYAVLNPLGSGVDVLYLYTDRNAVRLSAAHRLDMMFIWRSARDKKFKSEWHLGVYNVYNRATPISINIIEDDKGGFKYEQPGIFGTVPTLSYHFKF